MKNFRIIPRLEVKTDHVIKGIRMEGLRKVGDPVELAIKYFKDGADEIFYDDIVASLYNRKYNIDLICLAGFMKIAGAGIISQSLPLF